MGRKQGRKLYTAEYYAPGSPELSPAAAARESGAPRATTDSAAAG